MKIFKRFRIRGGKFGGFSVFDFKTKKTVRVMSYHYGAKVYASRLNKTFSMVNA